MGLAELNTLRDIESAIERLKTEEWADLRRWFEQYDRPQPIDLEADLKAGKIDDRLRRAIADHKAGKTEQL